MIPAAALIMAGGNGERMQQSLRGRLGASAVVPPKPLVPVRGVPLLERALVAVLRAGIRDVTVAGQASAFDIERFVRGRGRALAGAVGASIAYIDESRPLGTVGAVALLRGRDEPILVVNADNLTSLELELVVEQHLRQRPAMTVATHVEPFAIPFGKVRVHEGAITGYHEKPTIEVPIASGISVLGPEAVDLVQPGRPASVPWLVDRLLERGASVRAFPHAAPWIDVNDAAALDRAEALVATHPDQFERWRERADVEVAGALIRGPSGVLLERRPASARAYADVWDTPGGKIEPGEAPEDAVLRELHEELGLELSGPRLVTSFDDLDPTSGAVFRHHVFLVDLIGQQPAPREGQELCWMPIDGARAPTPLCPVVRRSLAALGRLA